ncbi:hypothetical protein [Nostoc sp. TCL26-01]|uniref:hypothetical protein n=1 Tax=Nostoc sp. TCL26-01 TaxID=2576904 RepID=UPI0015BFF0C5|nr:hypothetical protein [Nostoc sp. TCL26-01]QLE60026.1 hypothetical protein FD725_31965 [Nostoc sp. TCL26-01]
MRRVERLAKIEKSRLFSQKEAIQLSGFTRAQLLKWEEAEIVKPHREFAILYDWNQLIFLRVLYHLRQNWTFKQIETGLKNCYSSVDEIIQDIHKHLFIALGIRGNEIALAAPIELTTTLASRLNNDFLMHKMKHIFSVEDFQEYILNIDENHPIGKLSKVKAFNCIAIPQIILELKVLGEQLQIENFDLKVG